MKINIYKDAYQTCFHVAEFLAEMAGAGGGSVALSGGSTPGQLFRILPEKFSGVPWRNMKFFWADERMVSSQSGESNYGEFYRVPGIRDLVPQQSVFEIAYAGETAYSLRDLQGKLDRHVTWKNGLPQFDLILLGVGEDGHTASIFPDHLSSFSSPFPAEIVHNPYSMQPRITLTGSTINNARQVLFLCTGHSKAEVVESILVKKDRTLPAVHVAPGGELLWYLDEAAARKLNNQ